MIFILVCMYSVLSVVESFELQGGHCIYFLGIIVIKHSGVRSKIQFS